MKYSVKISAHEWHTIGLIVEADSEEDAKDLAEQMEGDIDYNDYSETDEVYIDEIKPYEN